MDAASVPSRARRTGRRILLAGVAGMAWLALSATGASADDPAAHILVPGGSGASVAAPGPDAYDVMRSALATDSAGPAAEATAGAAVPDPAVPAPETTASAPGPAIDTPAPADPAGDPTPAAPGTVPDAAPHPDPVPDPAAGTVPVPDPAAPVNPVNPVNPGDPAVPVPDPTLPAGDPVLAVPDPGLVLPVVDPAIPLPHPLGPAAGDPAAAPGHPAAPAPALPPEAAVTTGESSGLSPGSAAANEAAAALAADRQLTEYPALPNAGGLPPLYVPPPGSYGALVAAALPTSGGPAAPPSVPAPGGAVAPLPGGTGGPAPWHGGTDLPAPDAVPPAPGSGSGSGNGHPNGPTGAAAWIPSLDFYLPTTDADPIHGPLQHAPSAVSADPGSSPD